MTVAAKSILVLEDEGLIALDIEDSLLSAGFIVRLAPNIVSAKALLEIDSFAAAILDLSYPREELLALTDKLDIAGVPWAIFSGVPATRLEPGEFSGRPMLSKPATPAQLIETVNQLLSSNS